MFPISLTQLELDVRVSITHNTGVPRSASSLHNYSKQCQKCTKTLHFHSKNLKIFSEAAGHNPLLRPFSQWEKETPSQIPSVRCPPLSPTSSSWLCHLLTETQKHTVFNAYNQVHVQTCVISTTWYNNISIFLRLQTIQKQSWHQSHDSRDMHSIWVSNSQLIFQRLIQYYFFIASRMIQTATNDSYLPIIESATKLFRKFFACQIPASDSQQTVLCRSTNEESFSGKLTSKKSSLWTSYIK